MFFLKFLYAGVLCSKYLNVLFLLLYFWNQCKIKNKLKIHLLSVIFPVLCWLASLRDASANQSLPSSWHVHWSVFTEKGLFTWEPGSSRLLLFSLDSCFPCLVFPARHLFLLVLFIHFYTIMKNLVTRELSSLRVLCSCFQSHHSCVWMLWMSDT